MRRAVTAGLFLAARLAPVAAQERPPVPEGSPAPLALPAVREGLLSNGAAFLVVPEHEVPLVTVTVVVPGGRAADPAGREGTARLLAERVAAEGATAASAMGADLAASAGPDWTTVTLTTLASTLPETLPLLARAVARPRLAPDAVEAAAATAAGALDAALAGTAAAADRAFLRAVYGGHPYGRLESPESLEAVGADDLRAYHLAWFRPAGSLVVVSGAVAAAEAVSALEAAFGGWEGSTPPELPVRPVSRAPAAGPRVVVVHRPGAAGASLRLGTALVPGSDPAWAGLALAERVLVEGAASVRTTLQRGREWGLFQAAMEAPAASVLPAARLLLDAVGGLSRGFPDPDAVRLARGFLVESLPLQLETAQQVAARLVSLRVLGLGTDRIRAEREAVAAMGLQDLRAVAADHLDPARMTLVVAGDATVLRGALALLGDVKVVDRNGRPVAPEALVPAPRPGGLDASLLVPGRLRYRVMIGGRESGRVTHGLDEEGGVLTWTGVGEVEGARVRRTVAFTVPGFRAVAATAAEEGGDSLELRVEAGRATGSVVRDGRTLLRIDHPFPPHLLLGDMLELAVVTAPLAEGLEMTLPVFRAETGAVENVPLRVEGRERVEVPAGTFETWRVRVGGSRPEAVWALVEAPHRLVRLEPGGSDVVLELVGR